MSKEKYSNMLYPMSDEERLEDLAHLFNRHERQLTNHWKLVGKHWKRLFELENLMTNNHCSYGFGLPFEEKKVESTKVKKEPENTDNVVWSYVVPDEDKKVVKEVTNDTYNHMEMSFWYEYKKLKEEGHGKVFRNFNHYYLDVGTKSMVFLCYHIDEKYEQMVNGRHSGPHDKEYFYNYLWNDYVKENLNKLSKFSNVDGKLLETLLL